MNPKQPYFEISRKRVDTLRRAAELAGIREICFAVMGRGRKIQKMVRLRNHAPDKVMHHVIANRDVRLVVKRERKNGLRLLGLLHTHILSEAKPGPGDIAGYHVGAIMFIYFELKDEFRAFKLLGRRKGVQEIPIYRVDSDLK